MDDVQRAIVNTQRDVNEKIEGVKKFGGKLQSIIDPPPPPPPKPKPQALSSPLSLQSVIKNSFASATGSLKSSDVYNEGQNILEKIAESNEATLERLERERLWRITNGYEDGATSIPVGGLKKQNDVRGESKFKSQATKLDEGSQQLKISDEVKPVSSSIPDDTTTENDDDSTPPPSLRRSTKYTKPPPGPRRKYNPF